MNSVVFAPDDDPIDEKVDVGFMVVFAPSEDVGTKIVPAVEVRLNGAEVDAFVAESNVGAIVVVSAVVAVDCCCDAVKSVVSAGGAEDVDDEVSAAAELIPKVGLVAVLVEESVADDE